MKQLTQQSINIKNLEKMRYFIVEILMVRLLMQVT